MKRIKKLVFILFFILLFIPFSVSADPKATCSDVQDAVNDLETLNDAYTQLDCDNATDDKLMTKCNIIKVNKTNALERIFQYNEDKVCPSIDLSAIISANEDNCSNEFGSKLKEYSDLVMNFFYISAPFILIIFGSLDFFKILTGSNPEENKKHRNNFFKRLAAFLLLYLTPFIVRSLFSLTPYSLDGSYICYEEIDLMPKITSGEVSGTYGGYNYGSGGMAIAEAAKENAEFAKNHGFTYGCMSTVKNAYTTKNSAKQVCCATLVSASLYNAKIYDESELKQDFIHSAPGMTTFLLRKGWSFIQTTNDKDLLPGDVLIYECYDKCNTVTPPPVINGKTVHIGHVAVYAGDGKQYDHGTSNWIKMGAVNFWTKGSTKHLYGALRYNGS